MAQSITKKSYRIKTAAEIESVLKEAYQLAIDGRQGPVLIDIPMNLQREEIVIQESSLLSLKRRFSAEISFENQLFQLNKSILLSQNARSFLLEGELLRRECKIN